MIKSIFTAVVLLISLQASGQITIGSTTLNLDLIADTSDGLKAPWDLAWGPDDHLWFTDAEHIKRLDPVTHQITDVFQKTGFYAMSLTFHPDFDNTPQVYVVYDSAIYYRGWTTYAHLLRYDYDATTHTFSNETMLFRYWHGGEHIGGRVITTQDGKIMITTAEWWGDMSKPDGKTLRFNPDGTFPSDNAFPNDPTWSWGHRNPQGLLAHPNGRIYSTEHGQLYDANELNIIEKGKHYGWPAYDALMCMIPDSCAAPAYQNTTLPTFTYHQPPCGIDWFDHPAIPELQGRLALAGLGYGPENGGILLYELDATGQTVIGDTVLFGTDTTSIGRIRDVCVSPAGAIWMIGNDRASMNTTATGVTSLANIRVLYNPTFVGAEPSVAIPKAQASIHPNPVRNTFRLEIAPEYFNLEDRAELRIFSTKGYLVRQTWTSSVSQTFDASDLAAGAYVYRIHAPHGQVISTGKFIKQ